MYVSSPEEIRAKLEAGRAAIASRLHRPRGRDRGTSARRCCGGALVAWGPDRGAATGGGPHPPRSEWSPPDLTGRIGTTVRVAFVRLSWSTAKRVTPAARCASETIA